MTKFCLLSVSFFVVSTAFYMMDVIYYDALGWHEIHHTAIMMQFFFQTPYVYTTIFKFMSILTKYFQFYITENH